MTAKQENLVGGRLLIRNVLWSFFGTGTPILVAIVTIPLLIEGMGTSRFGVLTLAWMVVGYFSLFDLGIGRALTKLVSESLGAGKLEEIPGIVWTALSLMGGLGIVGAAVVAGLSPWLVNSVLKIPGELKAETLSAFYLLAISIPVVISSTGLRGILEAYQQFGLVNTIRLPLGIITFAGPLAVLPFSNSLDNIVMVLVLARFVFWLIYLVVCLKKHPSLRKRVKIEKSATKKLLSFGGWMTISNLVGPLLLYLGRFFIIAMISSEAVAYFVTPYEVVINLLIIPGVLVSVLFPAMTHLFQKSSSDVNSLYKKALWYIFAFMLPLVMFVFFFAKDGLALWINEDFSINGYWVAKILAIGVFINSFGLISQALIQGYGRPDLTAKLHIIELIAYVPYLWILIEWYGINGAAVAWTIRVLVSSLVLFYLAKRCINGSFSIKY